MRTNRVEIPKRNAVYLGVHLHKIADYLFVDLLGVAVWREGGLYRRLFRYGQLLRLSVHRAGRREYQVLYLELLHRVEDVDDAVEVVAVIFERLLHRLAHSLACGKVYHGLDAVVLPQKIKQLFLVGDVHLAKMRLYARYLGDVVHYVGGRIAQVVNDVHLVALLLQFYGGVAANEACAACYQYFFHIVRIFVCLLAINAPKIRKTFQILAHYNKKNSFLPQISTNIDILPKYIAKTFVD